MKEHTLHISTYFLNIFRGQDPKPHDLRPWTVKKEDEHGLRLRCAAATDAYSQITGVEIQQQQQETIVGSESRDPILEKAPGVWTRLQDA